SQLCELLFERFRGALNRGALPITDRQDNDFFDPLHADNRWQADRNTLNAILPVERATDGEHGMLVTQNRLDDRQNAEADRIVGGSFPLHDLLRPRARLLKD